MNILPDWIVAVDENLGRVKRYDRISPETEIGKRLKESDYDRLIVGHADLLADTLRQAEIIADDSDLVVLGTQVKAIDVLLAEVEVKTGEFRRLVLVEDKLFVNPEARRDVLAQVLDYSLNLEEKIDVDALVELLPKQHSDWLEENRDRIESTLHLGDYLLLICGDRIQERLIRLVDRFVKRADTNPLKLTELGLVSMAIYSDGATHLLIPNFVGAVIGAQRTLTIRVEVRDSAGRPVEAPVGLVAEDQSEDSGSGRHRGERRTEAEFFEDYWSSYGDDAIANCQIVLEALERSGIPGLRKAYADSGRPTIYLDETPFGQINILGVSGRGPALHDNLHIILNRRRNNSQVSEAVTQFRRALLEIPDAWLSKKRVYVPVRALSENPKHLIDVVDKFVAALRGG
jgi:hypothetical protein